MIIGYTLKYHTAYPKKTRRRFGVTIKGETYLRPLTKIKGQGFFIGYRWLLMSDYKYHAGSTDWEGDHTPAYATGKREKVFLVVEDKYKDAIIVRPQDQILEA